MIRERFEVWLDTAPVDEIVGGFVKRESPRDGSAFVTHHVPPFTANTIKHGEFLQMAECGGYVADDQIAKPETEPSCRMCRLSLGLEVL